MSASALGGEGRAAPGVEELGRLTLAAYSKWGIDSDQARLSHLIGYAQQPCSASMPLAQTATS